GSILSTGTTLEAEQLAADLATIAVADKTEALVAGGDVSPRYPQRSTTAHLTSLALAQRFLLECLRARCVMEWVRERELLIAQTLAFVQSVSDRERDGKLRDARKLDAWKPDARKPGAERDRKPCVEAAPIEAIKF